MKVIFDFRGQLFELSEPGNTFSITQKWSKLCLFSWHKKFRVSSKNKWDTGKSTQKKLFSLKSPTESFFFIAHFDLFYNISKYNYFAKKVSVLELLKKGSNNQKLNKELSVALFNVDNRSFGYFPASCIFLKKLLCTMCLQKFISKLPALFLDHLYLKTIIEICRPF